MGQFPKSFNLKDEKMKGEGTEGFPTEIGWGI